MIKEFKQQVATLLADAQRSRLAADRILPVEIPDTIDNYKLMHPIGSYLIVYKGSIFTQKDVKNIIAQNRNLEIMVVVVARGGFQMQPEEYLDFAIESLSGFNTDSKRTDRMIYCKEDEFIGEEAGVWSYAATFVIPVEFYQVI